MPLFIFAADTPWEVVTRFFVSGGFFMIPLIICSLISVTFILLRATALRRGLVLPGQVEREIDRFRPGNSSEQLHRLVQKDDSSLARIVDTALDYQQGSKQEAVEAVQTRARHEVVRLETGLVVLEVIIGIAPLLGLLGTVSGLVSVFANLGESGESPDPRGIALGISEALNTTIAGLAIAIPSLIGHSYFSKKIEIMSVEMESIVATLLEKMFRKGEYLHTPEPEIAPETGPLTPPPIPPSPAETAPKPRFTSNPSFAGGTTQEPAQNPGGLARKFEPQREDPSQKLQVRPKTFSNLPANPTRSGEPPEEDVPDVESPQEPTAWSHETPPEAPFPEEETSIEADPTAEQELPLEEPAREEPPPAGEPGPESESPDRPRHD